MRAVIEAGLLLPSDPETPCQPFDPRALAPLVATPPHPACEAIVILPARDEAETIGAALGALAAQVDLGGLPLEHARYEVLVLANDCRDATAEVARAFGRARPTLRLHVVERSLGSEGHVGRARRLLMDEAWRRLALLGRPRGVIASTDADSHVGACWLAATLDSIAGGADAVGGRILVDAADRSALDLPAQRFHLRDVGYRTLISELEARLDPDPYDPWPRHFQHFGPSIALTAEAYLRAGGMPPRRWLEDVALYSALRRVDARLRHDPRVVVTTSGRSGGRTDFGFAGQLAEWTAMGQAGAPLLVESAAAAETRVTLRQRLRNAWRRGQPGQPPSWPQLAVLADGLVVAPEVLAALLDEPQPFGMLHERVLLAQRAVGGWAQRWPPQEISVATGALQCRLARLRAWERPAALTLEEIEPVERLTAAD